MSGLGSVVAPLVELLAPLLGQALGAFLRTTLGMAAVGIVLLVCAVWFAADGSWARGAVAGGLVFVLALVVTGVLAGKRAVGTLVEGAARDHGLGRRAVEVVFDRLMVLARLQIAEGTSVDGFLRSLPLGDAEDLLTRAVHDVLGDVPEAPRGLREKVRARVVDGSVTRIKSLTLVQLREAATGDSGIDLLVIRDQVGERADQALADAAAAALRKLTITVLAGLVLATAFVILGVRQLDI